MPRPHPVLPAPQLVPTPQLVPSAQPAPGTGSAQLPSNAALPGGATLPRTATLARTATLPVAAALADLLPRRGLARGSVVAVAEFGLLCLALASAASASGAWCALAGMPEAGLLAASGLGLDAERTLFVPEPGTGWAQVVASLLDGCELVILNLPVQAQVPAQLRRRLEAVLRRVGGVLLVVGEWPGAQVCLRVRQQRWTGLGDGHGRLRACCAQVTAEGRGEAALTRTRWLWLPAEDGGVAAADPTDIPETNFPAATEPGLRAVGSG